MDISVVNNHYLPQMCNGLTIRYSNINKVHVKPLASVATRILQCIEIILAISSLFTHFHGCTTKRGCGLKRSAHMDTCIQHVRLKYQYMVAMINCRHCFEEDNPWNGEQYGTKPYLASDDFVPRANYRLQNCVYLELSRQNNPRMDAADTTHIITLPPLTQSQSIIQLLAWVHYDV